MVFKAGADDLFAVVEILGADEADNGVYEQRGERAGDGIGAAFEGLLIDAMVRVGGEAGALAGFEIHDAGAGGRAAEGTGGFVGLAEEGEVDAEAGVGGLGAGDALEHQVERGALLERGELRGDVGQDAGLRGDRVGCDELVDESEELGDAGGGIGGGVDADTGVAATVEQAVERGGGDAVGIVGGVIGLEADGERAAAAEGGAETRDDFALRGDEHEVLVAHELADGGDHFGREAGGEGGERGGIGLVAEEPVAEGADGKRGDGGEGGAVVRVEDETCDLVGLLRHNGFGEELRERDLGEGVLGGDTFEGVGSGEAGKFVAGADGRGLGEQRAQIGKRVGDAAEGGAVDGHRVEFSLQQQPCAAGYERAKLRSAPKLTA